MARDTGGLERCYSRLKLRTMSMNCQRREYSFRSYDDESHSGTS